MWEVYQGWDSIPSAPLGESTAHLLEFADEPMLLVQLNGEFSGDLEQESSVLSKGISSQSSESEQQLD